VQKQKKPFPPQPLTTFDIECSIENSATTCLDCFNLEKKYLENYNKLRSELKKSEKKYTHCEIHRDELDSDIKSYHNCNLITAVYESEFHGRMDMIVFADPKMCHKDDMVPFKDFYVMPEDEYYDKSLYGKPINRKCKKRKKKTAPGERSSSIDFPLTVQEFLKLGTDLDFSSSDVMAAVKPLNPMVKFLLFFLNPKFNNQVFIAHHGSGYDFQAVAESLVNLNISPDILSRGNKILQLSIPSFNIAFKDSFRYMKASLSKCCKLYNIDMEKGTFPLRYNRISNYESSN